MKRILEHIAITSLISGVFNYFLLEILYTLFDRNLPSVKHICDHLTFL